MLRLLPQISPVLHTSLLPTLTVIPCRYNFKGGTTGKKRFRLPVNTDAEYLVSHVAGSNIFKDGKDVEIKDDSHYPDWIWKMKLTAPTLEDFSPDTEEYWKQYALRGEIRIKRLISKAPRAAMRVGSQEKKRRLIIDRFKYRALASQDAEVGFDPSVLGPDEPNMKLWLRPQIELLEEEELYPDLFAKENPEAFMKHRRPWDDQQHLLREKYNNRKKKHYNLFPSDANKVLFNKDKQ